MLIKNPHLAIIFAKISPLRILEGVILFSPFQEHPVLTCRSKKACSNVGFSPVICPSIFTRCDVVGTWYRQYQLSSSFSSYSYSYSHSFSYSYSPDDSLFFSFYQVRQNL
jgi:hypothetical protein